MSSAWRSTLKIAAQQNRSMHSRSQIGTIECLASVHCNGGKACERATIIKMTQLNTIQYTRSRRGCMGGCKRACPMTPNTQHQAHSKQHISTNPISYCVFTPQEATEHPEHYCFHPGVAPCVFGRRIGDCAQFPGFLHQATRLACHGRFPEALDLPAKGGGGSQVRRYAWVGLATESKAHTTAHSLLTVA